MKRVCLHIILWTGLCLLPAISIAQNDSWISKSIGRLTLAELEKAGNNQNIDSLIDRMKELWEPTVAPALYPSSVYRLLMARLLLMKGLPVKAEIQINEICAASGSAGETEKNILSGWVARLSGDFSKASALLYPILNNKEAEPRRMAAACLQLSQMNRQIRNVDGADSLEEAGLKLVKLANDHLLIARFLILQSEDNILKENFSAALAQLEEAEQQLRKNPSLYDQAKIYNNRGRISAASGDYETAGDWYRQSLGIKKKLGDTPGMATLHNNLGDLFAQQYLDEEALREFNAALQLAATGSLPEIEMTASYNLAIIEEENNLLGISLQHHKRYAALKDSLTTAGTVKTILALHKKYELADKERKITVLSQEALNIARLLQKKTSESNLMIGGILLLLLLIGLYARAFYQKQKLNRQISVQNEELRRLGKLKDQIFLVLGHDLRMPLNSINEMPMLIDYCINTNQLQKLRTAGQEIDSTMKYINNLVDNLLTWALHQNHQLAFHPQKINLHALAAQVMDSFTAILSRKQIRLQNQIDPTAEVWADANALKVVIRNLIHNAGKFTEQGNITLNASKKDNEYIIAISDEGSGIEEEKIPMLFGNWPDKETGKKSTGLGLYLSKQMVELHKGMIQLKSKPGTGTIVSFTIPSA